MVRGWPARYADKDANVSRSRVTQASGSHRANGKWPPCRRRTIVPQGLLLSPRLAQAFGVWGGRGQREAAGWITFHAQRATANRTKGSMPAPQLLGLTNWRCRKNAAVVTRPLPPLPGRMTGRALGKTCSDFLAVPESARAGTQGGRLCRQSFPACNPARSFRKSAQWRRGSRSRSLARPCGYWGAFFHGSVPPDSG